VKKENDRGRTEAFTLTSLLINSSIHPAHNLVHPSFENVADTQQRPHGDRTPCFDLLPMTSREPKRNHILLAVSVFLAPSTDTLPQRFEKLLFVYHTGVCTVALAETPRAD